MEEWCSSGCQLNWVANESIIIWVNQSQVVVALDFEQWYAACSLGHE